MSSSSDSCDYQIRLESSRLLPVFEELQAVGFPVNILERKLDKLKKGGPCICFQVYLHLYKSFRQLFDETEVFLDQYILNDKVIDREGFAKRFFACLRQIIGHDQALPLYQYVCPGHPLSKVEEIADIAHELRSLLKSQQKFNTREYKQAPENNDSTDGRGKVGKIVDRLHDSFSSNKSLYGSSLNDRDRSYSQPMRPASIAAPNEKMPWRVVKESGKGLGSEEEATSEDEVSPDEGIERSWNASSSLNREHFDAPQDIKLGYAVESLKSMMLRANSRDDDDGLARTVLDRLTFLESHQNIQFRSIEDRLIKIERDFTDHNAKLDRGIIKRLDTHQSRLEHLEKHSTKPLRGRHRHHSTDKSESADQEVPLTRRSTLYSVSHQPPRSPSTESRTIKQKPSDSDTEPRPSRHSKPPSRIMSATRSYSHDQRLADLQREVVQIEKVNSELSQKGPFSEVETSEISGEKLGQKLSTDNMHRINTENSMRRSSSYFEPVTLNRPEMTQLSTHEGLANEGSGRRSSKQLLRALNLSSVQRSSRSQSVAPQSRSDKENQTSGSRKQLPNDDIALKDLNERIQLRLEERIKTAEDTLKACMETIRKDYVLVRRQP